MNDDAVLDIRDPLHRQRHREGVPLNQWGDDDNPIVRYYDEILAERKTRAGARKLVLFTPSLNTDLKEWIFQAASLAPRNCHWLIRVHPCKPEQRRIAREFLEKYSLENAEADRATDLPLVALLRHVDANISSFSTTVFKAGDFGVPSILTDPSGISLFPNQIASGTAVTAYNPQDLLTALEAITGKKHAPSHLYPVPSCSNEDMIREFPSRHLGILGDEASNTAGGIRG
jgi:hypothetical protein